jgi:Transposase DDE domain
MLLETIFAPFVQERPICVMARAIVERLLDAPRLDALCARTAQQQDTRALLFSSLVQLMSEVVLGVHPTVHAAYQANQEAIGVSTTALSNQLDRVETGVAAALGRDSAELAEPVGKAWRASHPRWLPGYQIKGLEGNHLASTAHRLTAWRGTWAAPFPGQALVVLDQQRRWITDVVLSADGHAQERRLLTQVLPHVEEDQLWIEDRNFCPLGLMLGMARRGAACVVRQHGQLQGERLGRATRKGASRSGPVYAQPMRVRDPDSDETMRVRRITVTLQEPTRDGDSELPSLSHVPIPRASATPLARLYGKRWSIETAFFEITTTLACEINTLGDPKAALFAFCLALLAYNAVTLIKAALRSEHGHQQVSPFNMVIFAQGAWRSRRAFRSDTRCAQAASSWDREDTSDISIGSLMTPTHATRWRMPGQRVLDIAPNAARESQSSCRRRYGQLPRTDNSSRPPH